MNFLCKHRITGTQRSTGKQVRFEILTPEPDKDKALVQFQEVYDLSGIEGLSITVLGSVPARGSIVVDYSNHMLVGRDG